jgi:membrane AbrB-like protein
MGRWAALVALSALLSTVLEWLHLPAALLLGPLIASVIMAVANARVRTSPRAFLLSQAVIGSMIARAIPASTLPEIIRDWPIFLVGIVSVLAVSSLVGWVLMRWQILPGTTAVWGTSPGAAPAMILMAESYGADMRLVAFMQYLRVVFVALVATAVARISAGPDGSVIATDWFPPLHWPAFAATLLLIVGTAILGRYSRLPAGPLLVSLFIGTALNSTGIMTIELPPWFLACAYALAGWQVGSRFDRAILWHAAKVLPRLLAANVALVALCGGLATGLALIADIDPLTAYLATSPGGSDTVAIIAASSRVDLPFIMAMQTARMFLVMLTGPWIARALANAEQKRIKSGLSGSR